jgi:hypothetical protein
MHPASGAACPIDAVHQTLTVQTLDWHWPPLLQTLPLNLENSPQIHVPAAVTGYLHFYFNFVLTSNGIRPSTYYAIMRLTQQP